MNTPTENPDPLLSVDQAAAYIGCGARMVRRLVAERRVPFVKVGRHVRFRVSALEAFLDAGRVEEVPR